jgi:hypothetical protein
MALMLTRVKTDTSFPFPFLLNPNARTPHEGAELESFQYSSLGNVPFETR